MLNRTWLIGGILAFTIATGGDVAGTTQQQVARASYEARVPTLIDWASPMLGDGPILVESAEPEHRYLRVVVVTRQLEQPWSMAFLPDGTILVTERPGRLRAIRDGVLDPRPVSGVPPVRAAGL
jgi:glucose/arabinose dehydrogenase